MHKIVNLAKSAFYKLFPEQRRGRERALEYERQTRKDDQIVSHFLFRRIKDMDEEAIEKLRKTDMGPIIEKMAKQEEARRNASH